VCPPRFGKVFDDPSSVDVELEFEPVESELEPVEFDVATCVPVSVSWRARPATVTTPTSVTPASPTVTVRARVKPRSRFTSASRCLRGLTPMLAAEPDGTVCVT
jgi:hypothetical protein